jgi:hypothetical protein
MHVRPTSRLRSRLTKVALATAATGALTAAGLATAPAASAQPGCDAGFHCLFLISHGFSVHREFTSDPDFSDDFYDNGEVVNNNAEGAINSSTGNFESHYYDDINPTLGGPGFLFCINPGHSAILPANMQNRVSSLIVRPRTAVQCL